MSWRNFINSFFHALFDKGNMRGLITFWVLALFTIVFLENTADEQYKVLLISLVSLATGIYLGKQMEKDEK